MAALRPRRVKENHRAGFGSPGFYCRVSPEYMAQAAEDRDRIEELRAEVAHWRTRALAENFGAALDVAQAHIAELSQQVEALEEELVLTNENEHSVVVENFKLHEANEDQQQTITELQQQVASLKSFLPACAQEFDFDPCFQMDEDGYVITEFNPEIALSVLLNAGVILASYRRYDVNDYMPENERLPTRLSENRTTVLFVLCSDLFAYSGADCEEIQSQEALQSLWSFYCRDKKQGPDAWV